MKVPFLISQKILYAASTAILAACIIGDIASVSMSFNGKSDWVFVVNMAFSIVSVLFFSALVFNPERTGIVSDSEKGDKKPVLLAARTYVCIIYFDVAIILFMVLFGSSLIPDIELSVIGVAAIIFIIGAVKFITDSRRINLKAQSKTESVKQEISDSEEQTVIADKTDESQNNNIVNNQM